MNIGIDIDGVLVDMVRFMVDYGTKCFVLENVDYTLDSKYYDEIRAFGVNKDAVGKFWNTYLEYYATKYNPRPFASEVISKLSEKHKIYIITARNNEGLNPNCKANMEEMVKIWLDKFDIRYDELIFTVGSKLPYCLENNIDIMIEDAPTNIIEISEKINVLCYDNPYNTQINKNNVMRVYSWYDILNKIENKKI